MSESRERAVRTENSTNKPTIGPRAIWGLTCGRALGNLSVTVQGRQVDGRKDAWADDSIPVGEPAEKSPEKGCCNLCRKGNAHPLKTTATGVALADDSTPAGGTAEISPGKRRCNLCRKRNAHPSVLCLGLLVCLYVPLPTTFFVVRLFAAGSVGALTISLFSVSLALSILFCCGFGCTRAVCGSLCSGIVISILAFILALFITPPSPLVGNATPKRVAVVGGGPSGVTSAWILAHDSDLRHEIDLFEYNERVGGHSDTIDVGIPLDIGFIFSTPGYDEYHTLLNRFNQTVMNATISTHFHGSDKHCPWDNLNGGASQRFIESCGESRARRLASDIDRFTKRANEAISMLDLMIPLWMWLWWNNYHSDFTYSALVPTLTPLFVTQHGNMQQSAGATLNHFSDSGFLTFNASMEDGPVTYHTIGGVQYLYERMVADMDLPSTNGSVSVNTEVLHVEPSPKGWRVTFQPRKLVNGARPPPESREYDEVVMAVNAQIAAGVLDRGSHWGKTVWPKCEDSHREKSCETAFDWLLRSFRQWTMHSTEYEESLVTLTNITNHSDPMDASSALYHIFTDSVMTGPIDRILDIGNGDWKLRVGPVSGPGTAVANDSPEPPIETRRWWHHRFNLWEHMLALRMLPWFNDFDGLHVAGDWTHSVGQNAAVISGIRAACAVGISNETKAWLRREGMYQCGSRAH